MLKEVEGGIIKEAEGWGEKRLSSTQAGRFDFHRWRQRDPQPGHRNAHELRGPGGTEL